MEKKVYNINGVDRTVIADPEASLGDLLRKHLFLTGTKVSCDDGHCGACTVLVEGKVTRACITPLSRVASGAAILTVEGIGQPGRLHPIQTAMMVHGAGRHHFETWLRMPTASSSRAIRLEFLTRLYFAQARGPACALGLLDSQVAATRAGLAELQALFTELPAELTFNRLGIDFRIRQIDSALQWLEDCRAALGLGG